MWQSGTLSNKQERVHARNDKFLMDLFHYQKRIYIIFHVNNNQTVIDGPGTDDKTKNRDEESS